MKNRSDTFFDIFLKPFSEENYRQFLEGYISKEKEQQSQHALERYQLKGSREFIDEIEK